MRKRKNSEIIRDIVKETGYSKREVDTIVGKYIDFIAEELLYTGEAKIPNIVKIYAIRSKNNAQGQRYKDSPFRGIEVRAKVFPSIKRMFMDFGPHTGKVGFVTHKNWRDIMYWITSTRAKGEYERDFIDNGFEYQSAPSNRGALDLPNKKADNETRASDETIDLMDDLFS